MKINQYRDICLIDTSLRSYQQTAKENIFAEWDEYTSVMLQMPTGTGKTRLFTSIIKDINSFSLLRKEPVKILVIAHRTELIDQIDKSLSSYSIAHGVIAGGYERNFKMPVQVASIQTITNKYNFEKAKDLKVQFVIIDEAHHSMAKTYQMLWDLYPTAKFLGVTATPWRMSGSGFLSVFNKLILTKPIKDFINEGWLAIYKYYSLGKNTFVQNTIDSINEFDIEGDYKISALEREIDISKIRAKLLDSYLKYAQGKKGIIYSISRAHSKHICEDFQKKGLNIVDIDSETPLKKRKEYVENFRRGLIDIIVNVDIFSEGFDCPDIEFIQMARPTRSLAKYLQQVGRGLRTTESKQACIILDNVGLYNRFGLPDANRHWLKHFNGNNEEEPCVIIEDNDGELTREKDFSEGDEEMVLVQDLVLKDNDYILTANADSFISSLYEWIITENNNLIINTCTYIAVNKSQETKLYLTYISRALEKPISAPHFINFIACVLNIESQLFLRSIAVANKNVYGKLDEKAINTLNAIVPVIIKTAKKQKHALEILIDYKEYISIDTKKFLYRIGEGISSYEALDYLCEILNMGIKKRLSYLIKISTNQALYLLISDIKKYVSSSMGESKYVKLETIKYCCEELEKQTEECKFVAHILRERYIEKKFNQEHNKILKSNYDDFVSSLRMTIYNEIAVDVKNSIIGTVVRAQIASELKYHYQFTYNNTYEGFRIIVPKDLCKRTYSVENKDCTLIHVKGFLNRKTNFFYGTEKSATLSDIRSYNILEVGDEVELRFKIKDKRLNVQVIGYNMIIGKLKFIPQNFNYKIKHKAVVSKIENLVLYEFKIID